MTGIQRIDANSREAYYNFFQREFFKKISNNINLVYQTNKKLVT